MSLKDVIMNSWINTYLLFPSIAIIISGSDAQIVPYLCSGSFSYKLSPEPPHNISGLW